MTLRPPTAMAALFALFALLVVAGCTNDNTRDRATAPTSDAGTTSEAPPTEPPTPTPETGPLVEGDFYTFHLPADAEWELSRGGRSATSYDEELNVFRVVTSVVPVLAAGNEETLDEDYELSTDQDAYDLVRGKNRTVDGVEGWTAQNVEQGQLIYEFGTQHSGNSFSLTFQFPNKDPRNRAWIDSVLASLEWK